MYWYWQVMATVRLDGGWLSRYLFVSFVLGVVILNPLSSYLIISYHYHYRCHCHYRRLSYFVIFLTTQYKASLASASGTVGIMVLVFMSRQLE